MPHLVIVAGPNGSGKTTLVRSGAISNAIDVPAISINADDIARSLAGDTNPTPEQSLRAAQMADAQLDAAISAGSDAMIETVLSSDKFKARVTAAKQANFDFTLVYVTVDDGDVNLARVSDRVRKGGHPVPADRIAQRRKRSHVMFEWFAQEADMVFVFDNSDSSPTLCAVKEADIWNLGHMSRLPSDLTMAIRRLAGNRAD